MPDLLPSLTRTQQAVLDAIVGYVQDHGYPPTIREIGTAAGIASTSSVTHQLRQLEYKGRLRRDPNKPRAIQILTEEGAAS